MFNYTVYDIITPRGTNYFAFMAWIGMYVYFNINRGSTLLTVSVAGL